MDGIVADMGYAEIKENLANSVAEHEERTRVPGITLTVSFTGLDGVRFSGGRLRCPALVSRTQNQLAVGRPQVPSRFS